MATKGDLVKLSEFIKIQRKILLDVLEVAYSNTSQWPLVRSKILSFFGKSGLDGHVDELIRKSLAERAIDNTTPSICTDLTPKHLNKLNHAKEPSK